MEGIVFTPAALIDVLSKIEELKDYDIDVVQTLNNDIQITIGESTYILEPSSEIQDVPEDVIEDLSDVNNNAYEEISEDDTINIDQDTEITSGIIKELAKTLLVGGMVRLTSKLLKK